MSRLSGGRRRRFPLLACFVTSACRPDGSRIKGTPYRNGPTMNGEAYDFLHRGSEPGQQEPNHEPAQSLALELVRQRLEALLRPDDLDLLRLHMVAGWSLRSLESAWRINRGNILKRIQRLCVRLREDSILRELVRSVERNSVHIIMKQ